jgi:tight adherence protein C
MLVFLLVFGAVGGLMFICYLRLPRDQRQGVSRLRQLAPPGKDASIDLPRQPFWIDTLSKISRLLMPGGPDQSSQQLLQAGFYNPAAARVFLGAKLFLMTLFPAVFVALPYALGLLGRQHLLLFGLSAMALGMVVPGFWLGHQVRARRRQLRLALPDALDMLVLCMEGGVSLVAAFQRMTEELQAAHPILGAELQISLREIQLGLSPGAAIKKLGERCALDDVRELANVLLQSERFGASVVKSLRTHAESWRLERQQQAEEMAQKAAVKILFPTLLCIFPAIFIVLLGPAAFQMAKLFTK